MSCRILICPQCGTRNNLPDHSPNLRPICGRCRTPLETEDSKPTDVSPKMTDKEFLTPLETEDSKPTNVPPKMTDKEWVEFLREKAPESASSHPIIFMKTLLSPGLLRTFPPPFL